MIDSLKRFTIILPSEHGSWALAFVPFIAGAGVGAVIIPASPGAIPAALLALLAVMAVFLARQPITLWVRIARGRGRRADLPAARLWTAALLLIAALAGMGLLLLGREAILWLALPAALTLAFTLAFQAAQGPRQLIVELVGVLGLALDAPAAYVAVTGRLDATAGLVWAVSALHSVISVLYVRLRIDERHRRATPRQAWAVVGAHILSVLTVAVGALAGWLPWLLAAPMLALLARALIVAARRPPIADVKRFGLTETGIGIAFALLVVVAFWR